MPWLIVYLVKCSLSLACLYIFYLLVLRPLTFYHWNRFYLLLYSLLSFFLPLIDVTPLVEQEGYQHHPLVTVIPSINTIAAAGSSVTLSYPTKAITSSDILITLFLSGVVMMLLRFLMQYFSLQRVKRSAAIIQQDDIWLYDVPDAIHPFSFGKDIFINSSRHTEEELEKIIQHEFVHVKQQHSIDLIIAELLCIFNWYNPFAWLIRKAIRENLEFIADKQVLEAGTDAQQYQLLLLKVIGLPQYTITNQFGFSSLKKRIAMMNKLRSAKVHLVKFLFLLPVCALILLAFRKQNQTVNVETDKVNPLTTGITSGSGVERLKTTPAINAVTYKDGTLRLLQPVNNVPLTSDTLPPVIVQSPGKVILQQLPGMQVDSKGRVTLKGEVVQRIFVNGKEYFITDPINADQRIVADTIPPVQPVGGERQLPESVKSIRINDKLATITYKDGKVEKYNLALEREKAAFDEKFAAYAPPPPPVPPVPAAAIHAIPPVQPIPAGAHPPAPAAAPAPVPLPAGISSMNVNDKKITIRFKDGKTETYDLNNPDQKAAYHEKYGQFPKVPQPPPVPKVPAPAAKEASNGVEQVSGGTYILSKDALNNILSEGRKKGEIFIGIINPLDIKIEHVRPEDMVIEFGNGTIRKVNGIFYALPSKQGMSKLIIFKKEKDGSKTLLKTLDVNVKRLPDPTQLKKESPAPANRSYDLWPNRMPWQPVKDNC